MTVLDNGHSRSQEKNVARSLYISIIVAVVFGMILFFWMGQTPALDPYTSRPSVQSEQTTPDAAPASH